MVLVDVTVDHMLRDPEQVIIVHHNIVSLNEPIRGGSDE